MNVNCCTFIVRVVSEPELNNEGDVVRFKGTVRTGDRGKDGVWSEQDYVAYFYATGNKIKAVSSLSVGKEVAVNAIYKSMERDGVIEGWFELTFISF